MANAGSRPTLTILISYCMQEEFIGVGPTIGDHHQLYCSNTGTRNDDHEPLPDTRLSISPHHIGPVESRRLLGGAQQHVVRGPVAQLFSWVRGGPAAADGHRHYHHHHHHQVEVIHVKAQTSAFFGPVVRDRLVLGLEEARGPGRDPAAARDSGSSSDRSTTTTTTTATTTTTGLPANEHIVHTRGINATVHSDLVRTIRGIIREHHSGTAAASNDDDDDHHHHHHNNNTSDTTAPAATDHVPQSVRVGVVGLWTDSTLLFLCYELATRLRLTRLATCSALTAARSRTRHFNSLSRMRSLLGVRVLHSLVEFCGWLGAGPPAVVPRPYDTAATCPHVDIEIVGSGGSGEADKQEQEQEGNGSCSASDRTIVCLLYSDSRSVRMRRLSSSGRSGARVYRVSSTDLLGRERMSTVLKVADRGKVVRERVAFERVREVLGNHAPQVRGYVELRDRGGIKFSYAGMGEGPTQSFAEVFRGFGGAGRRRRRIDRILHDTFGSVLGRLYRAASLEQVDLFREYNFDGTGWNYAEGGSDNPHTVRRNIARLLGGQGGGPGAWTDGPVIRIGDVPLRNVALFLEHTLPRLRRSYVASSFHYVCFVHGDLNGGNILTDANNNVFLIDFEYTSRTHILKDIAKIESDAMYDLTDLDDERDLREALRINRALMRVEDLREPLPTDYHHGSNSGSCCSSSSSSSSNRFRRAWDTVRTCRSIAAGLVKQDRNPIQMHIVLLRYTLHLASMSWKPRLNRLWALAAACMYAERIERALLKHMQLFVDWVPLDACREAATRDGGGGGVGGRHPALGRVISGRLGVTILPGRVDRGADIRRDMRQLRKDGVTRMALLCTRQELEELCVESDVVKRAAEVDVRVLWSPVAVGNVPTLSRGRRLAKWVSAQVLRGESVVVVSHAGLGRACCVVCAALMEVLAHVGQRITARDAIRLVKDARSRRAIDRDVQYRFVEQYYRQMTAGGG